MVTAYQKEVMIFGLSPQVLEDCLFPVSFHVIPVVDHTVSDGVVNAIARCFRVRKCFVADKEVKILNSTFGCKMSWFGRNGWCSRGLRRGAACGDSRREHTVSPISRSSCISVVRENQTYNEGSELPAKLEERSDQGISAAGKNIPNLRVTSTVIAYNGREAGHS